MYTNPIEQGLWNDPFEHYVKSLTDIDIQRMKEAIAAIIGWSVEDLDAMYELLEEQVSAKIEESMKNFAPVHTLGFEDAIEEVSEQPNIRESLSNKAKTNIELGIK